MIFIPVIEPVFVGFRGSYGLIFLDAHADFYPPEKSTTGEVADMDLALVTDRGPNSLTNISNLKPYVEDGNVIHIGQRDAEETKKYGAQDIAISGIKSFHYAVIKLAGLEITLDAIIEHIHKLSLDGFGIHFYTDVICDAENPAVDYRLPGGLTFVQIDYILNGLILTGKIRGMDITIFNPTLDKKGKIAKKITACSARAFDPSKMREPSASGTE